MSRIHETAMMGIAVVMMVVGVGIHADTLSWQPSLTGVREWNTSNAAWAGSKTFTDGDAVVFTRATDGSGGTVFIGTGAVAADVSPLSLTMLGGYGVAWTFTGGDITGAGSTVVMAQDNTGNFDRDSSYSFGGGTVFTANGTIAFRPATATGNLAFGSAAIGISNGGKFVFSPGTSGAILTNAFSVGSGGTIAGTANASFTGTVSMTSASGTVTAQGRNVFNNTWDIDGSGTINLPTSYNSNAWSIFNGFVDAGGTGTVTIQTGSGTGTPTDYYAALSGTGGWDVKDVILTGGGGMTIVPNSATYWSGVGTNGGKVTVLYGKAVPGTGNHYDNRSGTYTVAVDHQVENNARLQASLITVTNGATISGNGTFFANTVNVGTDGSAGGIAPGLSIGDLSVTGDVNLGSDAFLNWEFDPDSAACDRLLVTGDIVLGGTFNVTDYTLGQEYVIMTYSGDASGEFDSYSGLSPYAVKMFLTVGGGEVRFRAVPEPATMGVMMVGLLGFLVRRRRG